LTPIPAPSAALLALLTIAVAAVAAPAGGAAAETAPIERITWLSPAQTTAIDERTSKGPNEKLVGFVAAQWPDVQHVIVQANAKRSWQMLLNGESVCLASAMRTPEREKLVYFTSTMIGPPLRLIARHDKLAELPRNAAGEIELSRLLADERLRGALVEGRSYGPYIDAVMLRRPQQNRSLSLYAASDYGSKILAMLGAGRADYSIEYETTLNAGRAAQQPLLDELQSLPIAGANEPVHAGVACPRTAWGLAAIRGIDRALGTPAGAAMLRESIERWASPDLRQHFGTQIDAFFKERARPSPIR
jgi:uncharacterized protein (TIGR02285 family)